MQLRLFVMLIKRELTGVDSNHLVVEEEDNIVDLVVVGSIVVAVLEDSMVVVVVDSIADFDLDMTF